MIDRRRLFDLLMGALIALGLVGWVLHLSGGPEVLAGEPTQEEGDAGSFLLATGSGASGGALLFVLNTRSRVLNVYEAEGGTRATRGLTFVASRKIERDLYVTGYNDKSEYSYQDLVERFRLEETRAKALDDEGGAGTGDGRK
ncbi:MAG: hypothetical protein V2A76_02790 [Planctomycetota bacterium]